MSSLPSPDQRNVRSLGLDLDNTVIDYGPAYVQIADTLNIDVEVADREHIRAKLRRSEGDDDEWQCFQSVLYTEGLELAIPADGLIDLLTICCDLGLEVHIVSHKTTHGPRNFGARELRPPAQRWLERHLISHGLVDFQRIWFTDSLADKVDTIAGLSLDVFIDDLPQVLAHPEWPIRTLGIQYAPGPWRWVHNRWYADFHNIATWLGS